MGALASRDLRSVLDAAEQLGATTSADELRTLTARLAFELLPVERSGWVQIDSASKRLRGVHWPYPVSDMLALLPRDLEVVPLVAPLRAQLAPAPLRISDVMTRREWHAEPIWAELYGPNGGEYQLATVLGMHGPLMHALSLFRSDRDFSAREVVLTAEFARQVRVAARRIARRHPDPADLGLTPRQLEALRELETGATVRRAASELGVTVKTMENHLQEAYRRLGVNNRVAALRRLRGEDAERAG
jgi:DNA-binding CsgD family transcriptional regulator